MGVKSTTQMTRGEAEAKFVELFLSQDEDLRRRQARSQVALLTDKELEYKLEEMNDARYEQGYGYDNYLITGT